MVHSRAAMDHGSSEEDDYFVNGNGASHRMSALEIGEDEEADSLLRETAGQDRSSFMVKRLTFRKAAVKNSMDEGDGQSRGFGLFQGFLREGVGSQFSFRNFAVLATLSFFVFLLLDVIDWDLENSVPEHTVIKPPHQSSFGGALNPGQNEQVTSFTFTDDDGVYYSFGEDAEAQMQALPKPNVGNAVLSMSPDNELNSAGHYLHDPFNSPFASKFYKSNEDAAVLAQIEESYALRMRQTVKNWGQWVPPDGYGYLGAPVYDDFAHRDVPADEFPDYAWQSDPAYLQQFLGQGKALIHRVQQGIYAEYGYSLTGLKGQERTDTRALQDKLFSVLVYDYNKNVAVTGGHAIDKKTGNPMPGIAYLNRAAWDGLVRKLLHAMMTSDDFYVSAVGTANTYLGRNLLQTQIMQFNQVMEPVLDKLGVSLIARNMGMNASTTISALGGADIYGEADIMWYVPDPRRGVARESAGQFDLLHRQAILSGSRMPVILTPVSHHLANETEGKAWLGNIQPGASMCGKTKKNRNQIIKPAVPACEFARCTDQMKTNGYCEKHDSVCWVDRTGWNPNVQDADVGYQDAGFANSAEHQLEGRKLTLLVLRALEEALDIWTKEMNKEQLPLADDLWHVGTTYDQLRESIRTQEPEPGENVFRPPCEHLLRKLDPMICHMSMHALTEWTPRVTPLANRLKRAVVGTIADDNNGKVELYPGVDMLPKQWQVPVGQVDVHLIAIATNDTSSLDGGGGAELALADSLFNDDAVSASPNTDADDGVRMLANEPNPFGWKVYNAPVGFCDGSAQSRCNRVTDNSCLLSNNNHFKAGLLGSGGSDWLTLTVGNIKEGIILARFDLEGSVANLPDDFRFEYSIGSNETSLSRKEFKDFGVKIADDLTVYPLLLDREMSKNVDESKPDIAVGIRVSSKIGSPLKVVLTHIYYA